MANKYHFILTAASYSAPGIRCQKPFEITISDDDERFPLFDNPCFSKESVGDDTPPPVEKKEEVSNEKAEGQPDEGENAGDLIPVSILLENGIAQNVVTNLAANDYEYISDILSDKPEDLEKIEGIGEATAKKVYEAAEAVSK